MQVGWGERLVVGVTDIREMTGWKCSGCRSARSADGTSASIDTPIEQTYLPPSSFYSYLNQFLFDSPTGGVFTSSFRWVVPNVGNISSSEVEQGLEASQFRITSLYLDTANEQVDSMDDLRKTVESVGIGPDISSYPYTFVYIFYEQVLPEEDAGRGERKVSVGIRALGGGAAESLLKLGYVGVGRHVSECRGVLLASQFKIIGREALLNLMLALIAVIIITTLFIGSVHASFMVVLCVVMVDVDILGLMYMWGLTIDSVDPPLLPHFFLELPSIPHGLSEDRRLSSALPSCFLLAFLPQVTIINLVLAVGLAVDYSAHVAHAFVVATGTKQVTTCPKLPTASWVRF